MVWLRGFAGEGLRSVGVAPTSPIQERVLYPALARHLRTGISYGVPALSFGLEALKRVGRAPSTFGNRPSGGHISNVGGCTSTLLARIRSQAPLCVQKSINCGRCLGLPWCYNLIIVKPAAPHPPRGTADRLFDLLFDLLFVSGRPDTAVLCTFSPMPAQVRT